MSDSFEDLMNDPDIGGAFDNATAGEFGEDVPDGHYVCLVNGCKINQSKASGRWQISWDFTVVWDPNRRYKNRHIFIHDGITKVDKASGKQLPNDVGMGIIRKRFQDLGLGAPTKDQLPTAVSKAPGRVVLMEQKTKGDFLNIYFNGLVAQNLGGFQEPRTLQELQNKLKNETSKSAPAELPTQRTQAAPAPKLDFTDD